MEVYSYYVKPGSVAVDVGANIGAFTVPLAKLAGEEGVVHAIEALRVPFNLMVANTVLNGLHNVVGHHAFASDTSRSPREGHRVPHMPYASHGNYGAYSAEMLTKEELDMRTGTPTVEHVSTLAIDDLELWGCALIKIDVEGAEKEVLLGAPLTLLKYKPAIYVEAEPEHHGRPDTFSTPGGVLALLTSMNYVCIRHIVGLYNPQNYRGAPLPENTNVASYNALCVHADDHKAGKLPPSLASEPLIPKPAPAPRPGFGVQAPLRDEV